jgi:TolB-like protein
MSRIVRCAALAAILAGTATPLTASAAQQGTPVLVVVPFNLHGQSRDSHDLDGVGTAVADLLAGDVASRAAVRVPDRAPVQRAIAAQQLSRNGMIDRDAAVKAAKLLGADHVIYGGFSADQAGNVRLDSRGVNVATGAVEFTERMQGSGDDVLALVRELASRLSAGMSLPARQGSSPAAGARLSLRSLAAYGRALDFADRGDRAHAKELLNSVLAESPGFGPAKAALSGLPPE